MAQADQAEVDRVRAALGIGTRYVSPAVFAAAQGVSERTVYGYFQRGVLRRCKIGGVLFVDMQEAAEALAGDAKQRTRAQAGVAAA